VWVASTDRDWRAGDEGLAFLVGLALVVALIATLLLGKADHADGDAME
jgi:hypothetical protein